MRKVTLFFLIFLVIFSRQGFSEELDYSCLKSIKVDPNKSLQIDNQSVSCASVESYKNEVYNILQEGKYEYITENISRARKNLKTIEKNLESGLLKYEDLELDSNLSGIGLTLSTIGMADCILGTHLGCFVGTVSSIVSASSLDRAERSKEDGIKYIQYLKERLSDAEEEIKKHEAQLPEGYSNLIKGFNFYCYEIENNCL